MISASYFSAVILQRFVESNMIFGRLNALGGMFLTLISSWCLFLEGAEETDALRDL